MRAAAVIAALERAIASPERVTRFMARSIPEPNSGCWLWEGAVNHDGYGKFSIFVGGRRFEVGAHQHALATKLGRWPRACALHSCDTPSCVNPDHLREGTTADNNADCRRRGRHVAPRGTANGIAKLCPADVIEIRRRLALGETPRSIGRGFGVTYWPVTQIRDGRTWRDVP